MNTVLEALYLRRPRLEYVSPPVCPVNFSASGIAIFDQCFEDQSFCSLGKVNTNFLNFPSPPDALAFNVYYSTQESGQAFQLVNDGIPLNTLVVFTAGTYYVTLNLSNGTESAPFPPQVAGGIFYTRVVIPTATDAISYNLYKDGVKIVSNVTGVIVESSAQGWYQATKITVDGESSLQGCNPVLLAGTVPAPPPPPPAGPNWCSDPIITNADWFIREGVFGAFTLLGGWGSSAGICFSGSLAMTAGVSFDYAHASAIRIMPYAGPAANCRINLGAAFSGTGSMTFNFSVNNTVIVGTPGLGAVHEISEIATAGYSFDFSLPSGANIYIEVNGFVQYPPGAAMSLAVGYQNL